MLEFLQGRPQDVAKPKRGKKRMFWVTIRRAPSVTVVQQQSTEFSCGLAVGFEWLFHWADVPAWRGPLVPFDGGPNCPRTAASAFGLTEPIPIIKTEESAYCRQTSPCSTVSRVASHLTPSGPKRRVGTTTRASMIGESSARVGRLL